MVVLLALHREALIADERFERPNNGVRVRCLTSLANRQKHDTVGIPFTGIPATACLLLLD